MRLLIIFCLMSISVACFSHNYATQAMVLDTIGIQVNTAQEMLLKQYLAEGDLIVEKATSKEEGLKQLNELKEKWDPIWFAFEELANYHNLWVDLHLQNKPIDYFAIKKIYCALYNTLKNAQLEGSLPDLQCFEE